jgi:hypothetical protein
MESVLVGAIISVIVAIPISILWVYILTKDKTKKIIYANEVGKRKENVRYV